MCTLSDAYRNVDDRKPLKTGKVPEEHKGQAMCGQRLYRDDSVRESPHGWHTADNQSEEQHEEFPDECGKQNPAEKTCVDRNG